MVERVAWVAVVGGVDLGSGQVVIMVRCLLVVWWTRATPKFAIFKLSELP